MLNQLPKLYPPLRAALALCAWFGIFQAQGQVPSEVPPNASRVTASVLSAKTWPPGSIDNLGPRVASGQIYYSAQLKVLTATALNDGVSNIVEAGRTLEAFSDKVLPETLVGQTIAATLILTGDTQGARWTIKDFEAVPSH